MKVYTKTGDEGQTSLGSGERTTKDDARIELYGSVDELNALLGLALSHGLAIREDLMAPNWHDMFINHLRWVQDRLFVLGSQVSVPPRARKPGAYFPVLTDEDCNRLEQHIDTLEAENTPLTSFILPGGGGPNPLSSLVHVARTVCRRAERRATPLTRSDEGLEAHIVPFLNRLSDDLFVTARWVAHHLGEPETEWHG